MPKYQGQKMRLLYVMRYLHAHSDNLQRQVCVDGRIKEQNERVYYAIDRLYKAISLSRQVSFKWLKRRQELRSSI